MTRPKNDSQLIRWQPDVTVAAVCERDGRFLLVEERSKSSNQIVFNQPAGHMENLETVDEAVRREVLEETCRHFEPQGVVGLYRLPLSKDKTYIRYTFFGQVSQIDPNANLDPDIIASHWLTLDEIRNHQQLRSPLVLQCIEDYLAGSKHPLSIVKEI